MTNAKLNRSVLVVPFTSDGMTPVMERRDWRGFWQSVTGSLEIDEDPLGAAVRELREELGIEVLNCGKLIDTGIRSEFEIFEQFRHKYLEGVDRNTEYAYLFRFKNRFRRVALPKLRISSEHIELRWMTVSRAMNMVKSLSNRALLWRLRCGL